MRITGIVVSANDGWRDEWWFMKNDEIHRQWWVRAGVPLPRAIFCRNRALVVSAWGVHDTPLPASGPERPLSFLSSLFNK
jgi:hypothetical protein